MSLKKEQKELIVSKYQIHKNDKGSTRIQIELLSEDMKNNNHLKEHIHDYHSKRGFLMKSRKKQKLLKYFNNNKV